MLTVPSLIKELFSTDKKTEKNLMIVIALSPKFLGYLRRIVIDGFQSPELHINGKEMIDEAFLSAFTLDFFNESEDLYKYLDHDFMQPGGYLYDLGMWFKIIYTTTLFAEDARKWGSREMGTSWGLMQMSYFDEDAY